MSKKKINTQQFVQQIERITRERLAKEEVVPLDQFRQVSKKADPKTILVIDDDETMRKSLKKIFELDGFRVLVAADGTQLSTVLDDSPIELIILDIGLPWINGYELAKLLKENDDLKFIPLIFLSAKTSELDVRRGFEMGADDYIKKPFEVDQIRKTVHTLLKINS